MEDRIGEACGVFGVYAPGQPVAKLTYFGLFALQHRGQESAGIAVSDGQTITVVKDMGLVTQVFDERRLAPLEGHLAIGQVRYSTTGKSTWRNAQPVYRSTGDAGFALGHNGNLTNTIELAEELGLDPDELGSPWGAARGSFVAFALGALVPVLPYVFADGAPAFLVAIGLSVGALFAVGAGVSLLTGRGLLYSGARQVLIGAAAATVTYIVGHAFGVTV